MNRFVFLALAGTSLAACAQKPAFTVSTPDAQDGRFAHAQVYNAYGCTGGNVSPGVTWTGAPAQAKSYAVVMFDPDANTGRGFYHWLVINIPGSERELHTGAGAAGPLPEGMAQTNNDFGFPAYGGPCPPPGEDHHYVITVYALNESHLDIAATTAPSDVVAQLKAHEIAESKLTVMSKRE